jgi:hypothetical protein
MPTSLPTWKPWSLILFPVIHFEGGETSIVKHGVWAAVSGNNSLDDQLESSSSNDFNISAFLAIRSSSLSTSLRCRSSTSERRDAAANIGFIKPEQ